MCGITGVINLKEPKPIPEGMVMEMLALIQHRGPDEFGIYLDDHAGLGSARLSIIDLSGGQQPISNEDGTLWIVLNGEYLIILNFVPFWNNGDTAFPPTAIQKSFCIFMKNMEPIA